jgi:hypothetical protein
MRQTENKKLIDSLPRELKGTTDEKRLQLELIQAKALLDISKSLAIIADIEKSQHKASKAARRSTNDKSANR